MAQWMMGELEKVTFLYQENVVYQIAQQFGKEFTSTNANGNLAVAKPVLKASVEISGNSVVWERGERLWRKRRPGDGPGRQQD